MKIIAKSNFDLETFSEYIIADNLNQYYGKLIEKFLQDKVKEDDAVYPILVKDDYEIYEWQP